MDATELPSKEAVSIYPPTRAIWDLFFPHPHWLFIPKLSGPWKKLHAIPIRDHHPEYEGTSKIQQLKKQTIWYKNERGIWIDLSAKKMYEWSISMWKSTSLIIRKIKTIMWYHLIPIKMATIKKNPENNIVFLLINYLICFFPFNFLGCILFDCLCKWQWFL